MFKSHPVFDNEAEIVKTGNTPCPIDLKPWQDRLDKVVGKTATGRSRMRIVWGQDAAKARMIVCGRWRLTYPFWRFEENGEMQDIGIPRFYFEELASRDELMAGDRWEQARWVWEDGERVDVLGPCPEDGFYSPAFCVAYHDEACCGGSGVKNSEPCLGAYREPNEVDLERVRRALWRRDHASNTEAAPDEAALAKQKADLIEARDERRRRELRERLEDWAKTHAHTWTTHDPSVIKHGKYHWLSGHSKSGTPSQPQGETSAVSAANSQS